MIRNAWAKIYCDMLRHPRLVGRPDSDKVLWLGLNLYAKEHSPRDGVVRLDPTSMRRLFGIQSQQRAVDEGLTYFLTCGILLRVSDGWLIRDFVERQAADSDAERSQRARDKKKTTSSGETQVGAVLRSLQQRAQPRTEFTSESAWLEKNYRERHNLPVPATLPAGWETEARKEMAG